ncbi:MAG: hypothetical protein KME35_00740 [Aphanocapsa sp. GSE-SYN-MK-11-07L]|nr:hypothetical protein [Aphanocapsa sp. GSE-SYN-MK-11-07L]
MTESSLLSSSLLNDVRVILQEARGKAYVAANIIMVDAHAGKHYALRSELSWTHWWLIMRVEEPQARDYYEEKLQAELERRHILDWPQSEGGETS